MAANRSTDGDLYEILNITGLNTHGLKSNVPFISDLISLNDITFISEHWLSDAEKPIIN